MRELITVKGMVLSVMPVGEYDKRVVLLTKERGKITAFARGARRPKSPFVAAANPFALGNFSLYEGKSSYTLVHAALLHQFTELALLQPGVWYGFYFLEVADYFGREYTDEQDMLNLIYVALKALQRPGADNALIRAIFEMRTLVIQGEYPDVFHCQSCGKQEELTTFSPAAHGMFCQNCRSQAPDGQSLRYAALYALQYMMTSPLGRLFQFTLTQSIREEICRIVHPYFQANTDHSFKSLEILQQI